MRATQSEKAFIPISSDSVVHPVQTQQWDGLQPRKWNSNRKHYEFAYKDQIEYVPSGSYNFRPSKRILDVPRTGKELVERPNIRVATAADLGLSRQETVGHATATR